MQHPLKEDNDKINCFTELCDDFMTTEKECLSINFDEVKKALRGTKNHSSAGADGIENFWYNNFSSTQQYLARIFTSFLRSEVPIP